MTGKLPGPGAERSPGAAAIDLSATRSVRIIAPPAGKPARPRMQGDSVRSKVVLLTAVAVVLAVVGWDLWGPRHASLRDFDADVVAQLETRMWRAYYDRREGPLFRD